MGHRGNSFFPSDPYKVRTLNMWTTLTYLTKRAYKPNLLTHKIQTWTEVWKNLKYNQATLYLSYYRTESTWSDINDSPRGARGTYGRLTAMVTVVGYRALVVRVVVHAGLIAPVARLAFRAVSNLNTVQACCWHNYLVWAVRVNSMIASDRGNTY